MGLPIKRIFRKASLKIILKSNAKCLALFRRFCGTLCLFPTCPTLFRQPKGHRHPASARRNRNQHILFRLVYQFHSVWGFGINAMPALLDRPVRQVQKDAKFTKNQLFDLHAIERRGILSVLVGTALLVPMLIINRKTGKDQVPFGCFLTISTLIVIFFGDRLIDFYFNWPTMLFGF